MKTYFPVLARYNAAANRAMYEILAGLPAARLTENVGSFFASIFGVINHIYGSDVIWLQRFKKTLPHTASLESTELALEVSWPSVKIFENFGELRSRREALDALLERFVAELGESDLDTVIDYRNSRGQRKRFIFRQALIHVFNHQTHHRGQVAEILDQFGIDNDYSNIIATLSEPPTE